MLHPLPRLSLEVHLPVSSFESSAFPVLAMGRLPASFHVYDFTWCEISRLQIFLHVEASEFARLPGRSYRCILAGQPRLLRPGRTCFVTSACTGYANRPNQVIDGARTFTLLDSQPCRLLHQRIADARHTLWNRQTGAPFARSPELKVVRHTCSYFSAELPTFRSCVASYEALTLKLSQVGNAVVASWASGQEPMEVYTFPTH